jgi:hypothetical protein
MGPSISSPERPAASNIAGAAPARAKPAGIRCVRGDVITPKTAARGRALRRLALPLAALTLVPAIARGAVLAQPGSSSKTPASATLEQCVTAVEAAERSATFGGEMTALPGTAHMQMRIEVLEKMPGEPLFRTVTAPGLGVWRSAAPGVRVYKYLKQVTDLSAPALYRAAVRFRWLNSKNRLVRSLELRTPRCDEPAPPSQASSPGAGTSTSGTISPVA